MIFSKDDLDLIDLMEKNQEQFKDLEESIMMNDSMIGGPNMRKFPAQVKKGNDGLLNF